MTKTIFNYDFKLKDFEATKSRHLGQIKKIKADKEITYDFIIGNYLADHTINELVGNRYFFFEQWFKGKAITKTLLRSLKTFINGATREYIKNSLTNENRPVSWDTAIYLVYYKKINAEMKAITKEIIKNYI